MNRASTATAVVVTLAYARGWPKGRTIPAAHSNVESYLDYFRAPQGPLDSYTSTCDRESTCRTPLLGRIANCVHRPVNSGSERRMEQGSKDQDAGS